MAKLRGAKKAAFLKRMARGRAKARRGTAKSTPRRARRAVKAVSKVRRSTRLRIRGTVRVNPRRRVSRVRFRRNPMAVVANPGGELIRYFPPGALITPTRKKRRKPRKGSTMKRRRRKGRKVVRHRRRPTARRRRPVSRRRRTSVRRRRPRATGRVRGKIYVNPRRRRHSRRRRNPGNMGGLLKRTFIPYAVGFITSGLTAVVDTGLASYPMAKNLVKVLGAVAVAATVGRRHPVAATAAISAIAASQGYTLGTKLAGGMFAQSPAQAVQGLGEMARSYPELGALLNGGVGALLNGPPDVDDAVVNYSTALANMADDDY